MTYRFESANKGTIEVSVTGEYRDSLAKDIDVSYAGGDRSFEECDDVDEIIQWLVDEGVEFESMRSCAFNRAYIASVLIDGDETEQSLLDKAVRWTDADVATKLQFIEFTAQAPDMLSVQEAADMLEVTRARVNQLVTAGMLDAVKIGERYAISRASVDARKAEGPRTGRPRK